MLRPRYKSLARDLSKKHKEERRTAAPLPYPPEAYLPKADSGRLAYDEAGNVLIRPEHLWELKHNMRIKVNVVRYDPVTKRVAFHHFAAPGVLFTDMSEEKFRELFHPYDLPIMR
jgi:hypothetical protein